MRWCERERKRYRTFCRSTASSTTGLGVSLLLGIMSERIGVGGLGYLESPHGRRGRGRNQTVVAYQEIGKLRWRLG